MAEELTDPSSTPSDIYIRDGVWESYEDAGAPDLIRGFGSGVAPLLAGFSLTGIIILLTTDPTRKPPWSSAVIVTLTLTFVLLIEGMQASIQALAFHSSPADRLAWRPEASDDVDVLTKERLDQRRDVWLFNKYYARGKMFTNIAILSFLSSLIMLGVPRSWEWWNYVAVGLPAFCLVYEIAGNVRFSPARISHRSRLFPTRADAKLVRTREALPDVNGR